MNIESRAHVEDVQVPTSKARDQRIEIALVIRVTEVLGAQDLCRQCSWTKWGNCTFEHMYK